MPRHTHPPQEGHYYYTGYLFSLSRESFNSMVHLNFKSLSGLAHLSLNLTLQDLAYSYGISVSTTLVIISRIDIFVGLAISSKQRTTRERIDKNNTIVSSNISKPVY